MKSVLILSTLISVAYSRSCVEMNQPCSEDCNCCNHENDHAIRCEERISGQGRKCVYSKDIGRSCAHNRECKSQYCDKESKTCKKFLHLNLRKPRKCWLIPFSFSRADGIYESIKPKQNCKCDGFDPDLNGLYPDLYTFNKSLTTWNTIDTTITHYPSFNGPLQEIKFCNSKDCAECDPTCYKLEGFCEQENKRVFIQEGPLDFTSRGQCITMKVPSRPYYNRYYISLPCRSAPEQKCPLLTGDCACETMQPFNIDPPDVQGRCSNTNCRVNEGGVRVCHYYNDAPGPMELEYMGKSKVGDFTEIVYKVIKNVPHDNGLFHLIWGGACCFDRAEEYYDDLGNSTYGSGTLPPNAKLVARLWPAFDRVQCMSGMNQLRIDTRYSSGTIFYKLKVRGDVTMSLKTYTLSVSNYKHLSAVDDWKREMFYGKVMSPNCACDSSTFTSCRIFPIKLDELGLYGNCNQMKPVPGPSTDDVYDDLMFRDDIYY